MAIKHRIVPAIQWYEGMLLSPQHFQQQELRWEQSISTHLNHLSPYHWGVIDLEFDLVSLPIGIIRVLSLKAIMPDGLIIDYQPKSDIPPLEMNLDEFKKQINQSSVILHLAVPGHVEGVSPIRNDLPRFDIIEGDLVSDDNAEDNVVQIPRLSPRLTLIPHDQLFARYVSLPIAKVGYQEGSFTLIPYMPPCFFVPKISLLGKKCGQLAQRLREKVSYLSQKWQSQLGTPLLGETASQIRPLVQSLPLLESLLASQKGHPFHLHQVLCHIAGHISTLRLGQIPPLFPPYNHNEVLETFQPLLDWVTLIIDSLEKSYSSLLFSKTDRLFSLKVHPRMVTPELIVGLKTSSVMTESELGDWMRDAMITTESHFESIRIRRMTGASRHRVEDEELYDLLPGRGVLIFKIKVDPQFITPGERLIIVNPADEEEKRPLEIVLYLIHKHIPSSNGADENDFQEKEELKEGTG